MVKKVQQCKYAWGWKGNIWLPTVACVRTPSKFPLPAWGYANNYRPKSDILMVLRTCDSQSLVAEAHYSLLVFPAAGTKCYFSPDVQILSFFSTEKLVFDLGMK